MKSSAKRTFDRHFKQLQQHLHLKGLQPKTIAAYERGVRRMGAYFDYDIVVLDEQQLLEYFADLNKRRSWSTLKVDLYGVKFYYQHVLKKSWEHLDLIKAPSAKRLPDILTLDEASMLFGATRILSYRVFFFTLYSLGLRLGEGLQLAPGDIDAALHRVHVRNAKGNKDRFVPLPEATLLMLRRFWSVHRHPQFIFPNRKRGLGGCLAADSPLDRGGVQVAMKKVATSCGLKKRSAPIAFDTVMPLT